MEYNKYKVPDIIIQSLFANDKMKKGSKQLEIYLNENIPEKNGNKELELILQSYKNDLFDLNIEYKNNIIHGDITPIMTMSEIIQKFDPEPKSYFILFKPLFDLYQTNLEPKQIINFTHKITNFLKNKKIVVLSNFNDLFEVLILLKINQEQEVKNAGNSLNELLKETLKKYSDDMSSYNDYFDFDSFCNKINEKLRVQQYIIVDFLVSWIGIICQIKHVRVAKFILDTLPWILKMPNANKNPEECLIIIRKNINNNFATYYKYNKDIMEKTILIIIKEASPKANNINVVAWDLLNLFLKKAEIYMVMYLSKKKENKVYISANTKILNLKSTDNNKEIKNCVTFKDGKAKSTMLLPNKEEELKITTEKNMILYNDNNSNPEKKDNKKNSKISTNKNNVPSFDFKNNENFQTLQGELVNDKSFSEAEEILQYIPFNLFEKLLILITETYSHDIEKQEIIDNLNTTIKNIVDKSPNNIRDYGFKVEEITKILLIGIKNPINKNKERLLEWCKILYKKYKKDIFVDFNLFIKEFIQSLPEVKNNIFSEMVEFLCNIEMDKELTIIIIKNLSQKFMKAPELMNNESMVILIIEKLSKSSSINIVYESFSDVLEDNKNYSFISKMTNYLNQYLISTPNSLNFRKSLINNENDMDKSQNNELFLKMYNIWSFNPIALIVFCVFTEHFELTYNIILNLIKIQLDNEYYIHLGQLVQLLESDLYDYIRIRLLEPTKNIYLIKALYGILMLLPQGQAFNILSNRMSNVQALFEIENGFDDIKEEDDNKEEINKLIEIFLNNQKMKKEAEDNRNKNKNE